jgi:acetyl-CoA acetyltransferase family protein
MSTQPRLAILAAKRTAQAKAFGALAEVSAVELGVTAVEAAVAHAHISKQQIDEVILGNVSGPADSANIARVVALKAGIPCERIAHSVNRNCASGMESIISAWQTIATGRAKVIVAGGTESMSRYPLLFAEETKYKLMHLSRSRGWGQRIRNMLGFRPRDFRPINAIELGLTDPTCGLNMGQTAEVLAADFSISREDQDRFAVESHRKACQARERCFLSGEIVAVQHGDQTVSKDVGPREGQSLEQLAKLRPIFKREGSVTAGNSCPLTDGATAMVLTSDVEARELAAQPLGYVTHYAIAGCDPKRMGLGPVFAIAKLLRQTGMRLSDFDLIEINEAFAAQVLACKLALESNLFAREHLEQQHAVGQLDMERVNVNGGSIALGHPVGATGARLVMTLLRALRERGLQRGLATLCVGGGQGYAIAVET